MMPCGKVTSRLVTGPWCGTYGLRPELLAMSQVWRTSSRADLSSICAKGAPEAIVASCAG